MEKINVIDKIYLGLIGIAFIGNGAMYNLLPDRIGIHQRGGEMDSFISKPIFLLLVPAIMAVYYFYSNRVKNEAENRRLIVGIGLIVVNGVILYMNI